MQLQLQLQLRLQLQLLLCSDFGFGLGLISALALEMIVTAADTVTVGMRRRATTVCGIGVWKCSDWFYEVDFGARSVAGGMTAWSLTPNVREPRFQMHRYRDCAGDPLKNLRFEPLSFAYFSLRPAKKSRCLPRTGATLINQYQFKERPTPQAYRNKRRAGKQIKERPTR
ncbi:hypothetical protein PQR75_12320 [Paraburkholderia fungorum]|uniref:hypothetical protein n=1 Tax=Paraburkholderia fungorum TaxID=134537 RepID=UPI0038BC4E14